MLSTHCGENRALQDRRSFGTTVASRGERSTGYAGATMFRRILISLSTAAVLVGAAIPCAYGQGMGGPGGPGMGGGGDASRVDMTINAVSHRWQQAWQMAQQTDNPDVRSQLASARSLIDQARLDRQQGNLTRALAYANSADQLIQRALQLMHVSDMPGVPQQAEQAIREAEDICGRIRGPGPPNPRAMQANRLIEQARQAAADGHPDRALRFALMAQEQGRRAWQESMYGQMMRQRGAVLETIVAPLVDQATRLAQNRNDEPMIHLAEKAGEHLAMARQLDPNEQPVPRARLLEMAMRESEMVLRTLDRAGFEAHRAGRMIADAQAALDRASEVATDDHDAGAADLISHGKTLLGQARDKLTAGDTNGAQDLANQARKIAQRVIRQSFGPLTESRVDEAISRTDGIIGQAAGVKSAEAKALLANAQERQGEARQLLSSGRLRRALVQTRIAARLAQQARDLDGQH